MEYVCKVGMPNGEVVERTFNANDEAALRADLEQQGYYVFSVQGQGGRELRFFRPKVPMRKLLMFCQELAALLKAGLPLLQSLEILLERQKDPIFRASLSAIRDKIKTGIALSDAFKAEGDLYPPIFASTLVAGERSGNLEEVIRRFERYMRMNEQMKKKAVSAAVYPAVLLTLMIAVIIILVVWVIPQFKGFFEDMGGTLPLPTRILLGFSAFVIKNFWWLVAAVAIGIFLGMSWYKRDSSRVLVDRIFLRLPILGPMMTMYSTSQLARTLSTLLAGGMPLLSSLSVASASVGNRALSAAVADSASHIREGRSLTVALESTHLVDSMALEMVKVGEQTGALGEMLSMVSEFYDQEMETRLATIMGLVEPLLLVVMAIVVAGMLIAFYLPMFSMFATIQH
jgi:type IV pilus assembly protein PilC